VLEENGKRKHVPTLLNEIRYSDDNEIIRPYVRVHFSSSIAPSLTTGPSSSEVRSRKLSNIGRSLDG
jgi:hypothetical protein